MLRKLLIFNLLLMLCSYAFTQSAYELYYEAQDYRDEGRKGKALRTFEDALEAAKKSHDIQLQMDCHLALAELKDNVIKAKEALDHYKAFSALYKKQMLEKTAVLKDSVSSLGDSVNTLESTVDESTSALEKQSKAIDSLNKQQLQSQLNIKSLELDNEHHKLEIQQSKNRRNILFFAIGTLVLAGGFAGFGYIRKRRTNQTLRNKNYLIAKEKQKTDELLLNILPKIVADELKEYGKTTPDSYESATVMFTDFKGFTKFSEKHSPQEIVAIIDEYFCAFDRIIEKYNVEKIKTIGDAYMCVSGIPEKQEDHVRNMISAAAEMRAYVEQTSEQYKASGEPYLEMRIGLHTGPLVAGVVGSRKFAYDVWGDTVNIAARMEQSGKVGEINVSETVYQIGKDDFKFEYRGEVKAKNKGMMKMYFVDPASCEDFIEEEE